MGIKKMESFKTQKQWEEWRKRAIAKSLSLNYDDSWAYDKSWWKSFDGIYVCKWCAKPLYVAEYIPGEGLIMSCRTELCPGNIDHTVYNNKQFASWDIRELTNQYLFNSLLRF